MIKMVKAKDIKFGDIISTDGLRVNDIYRNLDGTFYIGGVTHGTYKSKTFKSDDELPIYYDDSNEGDD